MIVRNCDYEVWFQEHLYGICFICTFMNNFNSYIFRKGERTEM